MTDWLYDAVIYQIYVRSFHDSNGDGVGDLPGITAKLDYVEALGVDAIWLTPFYRSPMRDFGYDVASYREVDPRFGTLKDFDDLLSEAHRRGIRVILDQVLSHTSDEHPWFLESRQDRTNPKADWYVWADPRPDGTPPNNWLAHFGGGAWSWEPRRGQYYLHNFLPEQPDLNFTNPAVVDAVYGEVEFWLQRGVDGLRLDTVNMYTHDVLLRDNPPRPEAPDGALRKNFDMQQPIYNISRPENLQAIEKLRRLVDRYGAITIGELGSGNGREVELAREYTCGDNRLHTAYSFALLTERGGAGWMREVLGAALAVGEDCWFCWSLSNHDTERVVSRWADGQEPTPQMAKAFLAALLSLRGTIIVYQGEELGLPQAAIPYEALQDPEGRNFWPKHKGRDGCRTPMPWSRDGRHAGFSDQTPWLPVPEEHRALAVDTQIGDPTSVLSTCRRFLAWRKRRAAFAANATLHLLPSPEPVLALRRDADSESVAVIVNMSNAQQRVPLERIGRLEPLDGHGFDRGEPQPRCTPEAVQLPPYGVFVGQIA